MDVIQSVRRFNGTTVPQPSDHIATQLHAAVVHAKRFELPLDFEIGCGAGMHPIEYNQSEKQRVLIAVEHTRIKYQAFCQHLLKNQQVDLRRLVPLHANAISVLTHLVPPASIERIYLLYPNPEPKARNRRWFCAPFMAKVLDCLVPGGTVHVASNIDWYFNEALHQARNVWGLQVTAERSFNENTIPFSKPRTHFEKKYLERGQICYDAILLKPNR
ncbi:MAG TPA: SAM-dependent methyltransferase [Oligoflexia bacterium]|nr:SAM-dependent methyltransferase [Oligoflexia bacterium]